MERSGLGQPEFASRIGVTPESLAAYLDGSAGPSASLMIRMRRLSDRFVKMNAERSAESN
jgi:transcriptional regulator with XRE-family HTH domain